MKRSAPVLLLPVLLLAGCVTPVGPVEVTRFHAADVAPLGKGTISVEPAPGMDGNNLEWQSYRAATMRQLVLLGYTEASAGNGAQVATMSLSRQTVQAEGRSPVSVGVGGSTGSYGSGLGLGIGLNLSPRPGSQVVTDLAVTIKDRATGTARAVSRISSTSP